MLNINTIKNRLDLTRFGPMVMYYSVDSLDGRLNHGEELNAWPSVIGGPQFRRSGGSLYPVFLQTTNTNRPSVLNSSGSSNIFTTADTFSAFDSFTLFVVFAVYSSSLSFTLTNSTSASGLQLFVNTSRAIQIGLVASGTYWVSANNLITLNKPYVFTFRIHKGENTYKSYLNGVLVASGIPGTTSNVPSRAYAISQVSNGAPVRIGSMSELAIYSTPLSEPLIETISYDLMDYYGIS